MPCPYQSNCALRSPDVVGCAHYACSGAIEACGHPGYRMIAAQGSFPTAAERRDGIAYAYDVSARYCCPSTHFACSGCQEVKRLQESLNNAAAALIAARTRIGTVCLLCGHEIPGHEAGCDAGEKANG